MCSNDLDLCKFRGAEILDLLRSRGLVIMKGEGSGTKFVNLESSKIGTHQKPRHACDPATFLG